ncbi:MAG: 16S rRNA processing protein RimM [uncultured Solirubrobacteraceae bacterium]|uniref:Ribosome maturation factor RimM n=1 Tax=uncultured Solirubrobacteraceae bacterium TaxID=1162706 RepID=A0A6J4RAQ7_9ACTN|nr:MAG: 16S rRNA processing protein RimM [uncultured Solirubrobacteraceae bacterium]
MTASGQVEIGRVGRPHGLDGSFYVAAPEDEALTVGRRVEVAGATAEIERRAGTAAKPIVRVSGCASRDAAEALRGTPLLVERSELPALAEGEFWADDLLECAVWDGDIAVGTVSRLIGLPSCEVIEVRRDAGEPLLVPLVSDAVRSIDLATRRVDVDLVFLGER